jgi:DNA-binding transcriptional LysR family regulator
MDLHQLRCFIAVAEELHFGRAAQRLDMLPSALGRHIRILEEDLGTRLLARTTRNTALTEDGALLLDEARILLSGADALAARFQARGRSRSAVLRVGAIDTAAAGLVPMALHDFRERCPNVAVQLLEEKTIRLLPRLLTGRLDLAFVRPPESPDKRLEFLFLFHETAMVALPAGHPLVDREYLRIRDIADEPLIVPERRSRPHSHDLTIKLFAEAGLQARIAQVAEEKQTIIGLVAAQLGIALVPRWTARMVNQGVCYVPLEEAMGSMSKLPLAAAWLRNSNDDLRDSMLAMLRANLRKYAEHA